MPWLGSRGIFSEIADYILRRYNKYKMGSDVYEIRILVRNTRNYCEKY